MHVSKHSMMTWRLKLKVIVYKQSHPNLFTGLKKSELKYCLLIYHERNILLAGRKNAAYKTSERIPQNMISFGCLGLFHKLCSTNSTMEQLHKKLEFVEYLFRCSHNSTAFSSNWVRGAETVWLKNVERSWKTWSRAVPNTPLDNKLP